MIFTIEFFRIRPNDDAHATLDRLSVIVDDLDAAKVKARSLFDTLEMPQKPDGLRILDESGCELFFGTKGKTIPRGPRGERRAALVTSARQAAQHGS
jgi:hypothetical protein